MKVILAYLVLIFILCPAWADEFDEGPLFGPEFTFIAFPDPNSDSEIAMSRDRALRVLVDHIYDHLVLGQPEGAKFRVPGNNQGRYTPQQYHNLPRDQKKEFTSPNGWTLAVGQDIEVIEARMPPLTAGRFEEIESDLQDALFISAANNHIFPALFQGGGHINIDAEYFENDVLLFRNFIVDLLNRNELSLGILNYDTRNALPLELHSNHTLEEFLEALADFDESAGSRDDLVVFLRAFNSATTASSDFFTNFWNPVAMGTQRRGKHTAINLGHALGANDRFVRIEIRSVRPQASASVWTRQTRLLKKRIDYLRNFDYPIPYKPTFELSHLRGLTQKPLKEHRLAPPVDPQKAIAAFYEYVIQAGEKWEDHQDYLWPQWITNGEVERFNSALCSSLFHAAVPN